MLRVVPVRRGRGGAAGGGGGGGGGGFGGGGGPQAPIDPAEPLLLRAVDDETKASGFYRDQLGQSRPPEKIVMADAAFGAPIKADDADVWMVTRGTFTEFPNLWVGPSLTQLTRISDANPAAEGIQLGQRRAGPLDQLRWRSAQGPAVQAGELRSGPEVPDGHLLLRVAVAEPAQLPAAQRPQCRQPDALRVQRLPGLRAGHPLRERLSRARARSNPSCRGCRCFWPAATSIPRAWGSRASHGADTRSPT